MAEKSNESSGEDTATTTRQSHGQSRVDEAASREREARSQQLTQRGDEVTAAYRRVNRIRTGVANLKNERQKLEEKLAANQKRTDEHTKALTDAETKLGSLLGGK